MLPSARKGRGESKAEGVLLRLPPGLFSPRQPLVSCPWKVREKILGNASARPAGMMKEKDRDQKNCTYQGESWQPKTVKQEEEEDRLEMHLNRLEAAATSLPGKSGANGLPQAVRKPSGAESLQPGSGAAGEEVLLLDCRAGPAVRACRPQLGEMPHWCLECGKNFDQKSELEMHQSKHTGQSSYICSDCGRGFMEHVALAAGQGACAAGNAFSPAGSRRRGLPLPGEAVVQRKERKELSLQEKVRVLEMLEGPKVSQSELAKRFGVSQPQICRIIKNKERILAEWGKNANPGRKRKLEEKGPAGDQAFLQWFERSCGHTFPSEGRHWQEKASLAGEPGLETSLRWRNGSQAKPKAAPARPLLEKWSRELLEEEEEEEESRWESTTLPCVLSQYDLPDVYACGETGMLFRATPEDLAPRRSKEASDQLTVLLCTNMDGSDKRDVLVVGKAARLFGFQAGGLQELPSATYRANSKAWMTAAIFTHWLQRLNEEMKQKERRVVLFLTQCSVHPHTELSNIQMVFMPPHLSWLRPLEQGVIQNFKCHYRRRLLTHLLVRCNSRGSAPISRFSRYLTLPDAVHLVVQAWSEVCPQTIANSFKAAGFSVNPRILTPPLEVVQALGCKDQDQFERFVLMDEGLECFGDQEGAEATKGVQQHQEPPSARAEGKEEKEEPLSFSCPSKAEVLESLAKLRRYLEGHSAWPATFHTFYQLEDLIHAIALSDMQVVKAKACKD
ncbi:tigger transposable element-derived protein 3-like isoform X2 [Python bivittatus]|uniref:Tigger transposable element-derived protein 3-like isoform X2 n=1 Tax=Python bivittatus TaxID=176946 RepID=A0A9F5N4B2_PYTBI|nr:tigger transposable element-derived protein 3-like isoform X2 [Python bivittatus]